MLYVTQVMTGNEHFILERCRKDVLEESEDVFVPVYDRKKRIRGEDKLITEVLFPGYLFFNTDDPQNLYLRLKKLPYLTKLLRDDDYFLPVSREEEEQLLYLGGEDHHVRMSIGIIKGTEVIITEGPLKGFKGPLMYINRHKKIAIIGMEMCGKINEVEIGLEIIKKTP